MSDLLASGRQSVRRFGSVATVGAAMLLMGLTVSVATQAHEITKGPAGLAFYTPPAPLPAGQHGDLIWARRLTNKQKLPAAAQNWRVLYRSTNVAGEPVAVSGTVAIPKGTPPKGGWPVISWTHGTTGVADVCAPSRNDGASYQQGAYINLMNASLNKWVKKGYVVAQTDYEGLGTPGPHPYLVGDSEARSATDIVYAARQLGSPMSRDWIVMGHSQGGGAAVYTAVLGPLYGTGLDLKGAVAISPDSFLTAQMEYTEKHIDSLPASPAMMGVLDGAAAVAPGVNVASLLTPLGKKVNAVAQHNCLAGIAAYAHKHKITKMSQLFKADADYSAVNQAFTTYDDTQNVRPTVSLLVLQADNDEEALKRFTDRMVDRFRIVGVPVQYHVVHAVKKGAANTFHRATVPDTLHYAMKWVDKRLPAGH